MTVFEEFVAFAEALPDDRRAVIAELVSDIMGAEGDWQLSREQLAELDRRMADPNPDYADPAEVEAFFARYRA
jgi:putative addiction module component (TIGR02574 family)